MLQKIIVAGSGGQGVLSMGQLLAYAGMLNGKQVAWMPSYGMEMRGGTANCAVTISDKKVSSPIVTEPSAVMAMNIPSLKKFEPLIAVDGLLLVNSSHEEQKTTRKDIKIYEIPVNKLASELGNPKVANMVMLGAYLELTKAVSLDSIIESLRNVLPERRHNLIPLNRKALEIGAREVSSDNLWISQKMTG